MTYTLTRAVETESRCGVQVCWQVVICDALSDAAGRARSEPCCKLRDPMFCFCSSSPSFLGLNSSLGLLIFYFPSIVATMTKGPLGSEPLGPPACPQHFRVLVGSSSTCTLFNWLQLTVFGMSTSASFLCFLCQLPRFPSDSLLSPWPSCHALFQETGFFQFSVKLSLLKEWGLRHSSGNHGSK